MRLLGTAAAVLATLVVILATVIAARTVLTLGTTVALGAFLLAASAIVLLMARERRRYAELGLFWLVTVLALALGGVAGRSGPSRPGPRPISALDVPSRYLATAQLSRSNQWTIRQRLWLTVPRHGSRRRQLQKLLRRPGRVERLVRGQGWRVATPDTHGLPLVRRDVQPARELGGLHWLAANRLPLSEAKLRLPAAVVISYLARAGSPVTLTAPRHSLYHLDPPGTEHDIPDSRELFRVTLPDDGSAAVAVDVARGPARTGLYAAVQGHAWATVGALLLVLLGAWATVWLEARRHARRAGSPSAGGPAAAGGSATS